MIFYGSVIENDGMKYSRSSGDYRIVSEREIEF
jgi:hypothetical protein